MKLIKTLKCSIIILTFAFSFFEQDTTPNKAFLAANNLKKESEFNSDSTQIETYDGDFTLENKIIENIPPKYLKRYKKWKNTFLTTKTGQALWDKYNHHPSFTLKITVIDRGDKNKNCGAEIGDFVFDARGFLKGATITFGNNMEEDSDADNEQYPILSAMRTWTNSPYLKTVSPTEKVIAIIAHEFGHLEDFILQGKTFYQMQMFFRAKKKRLQELQSSGLPLYQAVDDWSVEQIEMQFQCLFGVMMKDVQIRNEQRAEKTAKEVIKDFYGKEMPRLVQVAVKNYEKKYPN